MATTIPTDTAVTTTTTTKTASSSSSTTKKAKEKTKEKTKENRGKDEEMDYSMNLKRRRDSGDTIIEEGGKTYKKATLNRNTDTVPNTVLASAKGEEKITRPERPAQIIPPPQSTPAHLPDFPFSPKIPSLSPVTTPNLLIRSHSATRETTPPAPSLPIVQKQRSRSATSKVRRALTAFHFCEDILQPQNLDHVVKKSLKPLLSFKTMDSKDITNPYLFQDAPMLTTFVRSAGNRTKELWQFDDAIRTDVMLADTKNSMLKKMLPFCAGRVPILVYPSFYRSLKFRYPMVVGGITRNDRVNTELGTGSLRQTVGILTPKDFRPVVDTE